MVPNILVVDDFILPVTLYPAEPTDTEERDLVAAMLRNGEAGMTTNATKASMDEAALLPASFNWIINGMPLPDISKLETRMRVVNLIKQKVLESTHIKAKILQLQGVATA